MNNAKFHHASIDLTFSRLAVSADHLTVKVTIGAKTQSWPMTSAAAVKAALATLQGQMFTNLERVAAVCRACNAQDTQANLKPLNTLRAA